MSFLYIPPSLSFPINSEEQYLCWTAGALCTYCSAELNCSDCACVCVFMCARQPHRKHITATAAATPD